mgnify:CR=1 FL=1
MSKINVRSFSNENDDGAPDIVGVSTFSSTAYFVPTKGTTAQRPSDHVEVGSLRFNTDTSNLEYYRGHGIGWSQFELIDPDLGGGTGSNTGLGTRALFSGGNNGSTYDDIEFITISTLGNTQDFGNLVAITLASGNGASRTRGVIGGGQQPGSFHDKIDFVTIASTGNASDFGNLTSARDFLGGLSNQTRGLFFGGRNPSSLNIIDYITIAQTGNAVDFGDLLSTRHNYPMGAASSTRGLMAACVGGTPTKEIDFVTISTTGNGQDFGDTTVIQGGAGASNSTRAIFAGGYISPAKGNVIEFATIATLGNSQDFGDLTSARRGLGGVASPTRACFAGGQTSEDVNTIDYVTIATLGNAADFGDLTLASSSNGKKKNVSGCSNGHGGL